MDRETERRAPVTERRIWRSAVVLGLGVGGFFDGIVFHQVLQWHHMLSSHPDPGVATDLPLNVRWDGLFHVVTYLLTVAGVALLWRALGRADRMPSRLLPVSGVVAGWGAFNVIEGTINHFLLGVHHTRPDGPGGVLLWDAAYLAWGVVFVGVGYALARRRPVAE